MASTDRASLGTGRSALSSDFLFGQCANFGLDFGHSGRHGSARYFANSGSVARYFVERELGDQRIRLEWITITNSANIVEINLRPIRSFRRRRGGARSEKDDRLGAELPAALPLAVRVSRPTRRSAAGLASEER